jgi:hypothetical protein
VKRTDFLVCELTVFPDQCEHRGTQSQPGHCDSPHCSDKADCVT